MDSRSAERAPLVSIITPTYNHGRFIRRCIESVLAQTYPRWEMLVVDDASEDDTASVVESMSRTDSRIRLLRHGARYGPGRLAETYNEALHVAEGDLVAVLEGDDYWHPRKLERQVDVFRDSKVVLSYGGADEVDETGRLVVRSRIAISETKLRTSPLETLPFFARLRSVTAVTVVVRRSALETIGGFQFAGVPLVDYPTWVRLSLLGDFVRVPTILGYWRRHRSSVFWRFFVEITVGLRDWFVNFIRSRRDEVVRIGLDPEGLVVQVMDAAQELLDNVDYFSARNMLASGEFGNARSHLKNVVLARSTRLPYRARAAFWLLWSMLPSPLRSLVSEVRSYR